MSELEACPFCGSFRVGIALGIARCQDCGARIDADDNDAALAAWNRRAIDSAAIRKVAEEMDGLDAGCDCGPAAPTRWAADLRRALGDQPRKEEQG